MIRGYITNKHVFMHPLSVISIVGFSTFVRILISTMDSKPHCFADFLMR